MSLTVAELNTRLTAETKDLERGLARAQAEVNHFASTGNQQVGGLTKGFDGLTAGISATAVELAGIGVVAAAVLGPTIGYLNDAVGAASDLVESANAVGVAFGSDAQGVLVWARNLDSSFGATTQEALGMVSTLRLVAQQSGLTTDEIETLAERAFDLGSVWNASAADVARAIESAFVGEFEPIRRFGVVINQASIEHEAFISGIDDGDGVLSQAEKQQAIFNLVMRETASAQGDAAGSAYTLAGQQRVLRSETDKLKTEVGALLIPAFTEFFSLINSVGLPLLEDMIGLIGETAGNTLKLGGLVTGVVGKFADLAGLSGVADWLGGVSDGMTDTGNTALHLRETVENQIDALLADAAASGATRSATVDLADANDMLARSALTVEDAVARQTDAQWGLRDAQHASQAAQRAVVDAQAEYDKLLRSGGVDADKVSSAQERLTSAQEDYNRALRDAADRHLRDVERATEDVARAQHKLAKEGQDVVDAQAKLAKLQAQKKAREEAIKAANAELDAADTVTERIIAQDALSKALGMEIVTNAEIEAATRDVALQQGEAASAAADLSKANSDLSAVQAEQPAQFDSVKDAAARVTKAQDELNKAQQQSPTFAEDLADAQLRVEDAQYRAEKATWSVEKAQRALNKAVDDYRTSLASVPAKVTTEVELKFLPTDLGAMPQPTAGGQRLPFFEKGGTVPGAPGQAVPIMAHAGETVVPAGGGGAGVVVNVNVAGDVIGGSANTIAQKIQELLLEQQRRNGGTLGFN